jgi:ribosomal protein S18 acetylase RimI-like enzyme
VPARSAYAGFVVRPAVAGDAPAVTACVIAAYRHYVDRNGKYPAPMLDDYAQVIAEHDVTVAERDGQLVGVLVVREAEEGFLLDNIAVHPDAQGASVGRSLLLLAEDKARAAGYDSIYLYTQEIMVENQALYTRAGYAEYARRHEVGLDRIYMRKQLAPES